MCVLLSVLPWQKEENKSTFRLDLNMLGLNMFFDSSERDQDIA